MDHSDDERPPKPAWMSKETAEALPYPGVTYTPTYDEELDPTPDEDPDQPSPARINRHREIARLSALGRLTSNEIAERTGYTPARISILLQSPFIKAEIARYRDAMFDQTVADGLKAMGPDAIADIHGTILDKSVKAETRNANSRWVVEKLTGKAKQEVAVDHGGLGSFMELLNEMRTRGEPIDVTPQVPALEVSQTTPETPAAASSETPKTAAYWAAHIQGKR